MKHLPLKFDDFVEACRTLGGLSPAHRPTYLAHHAKRLYATYRVCSRHLNQCRKVLSLGTGVGYIERVLAKHHEVEITAVDFFQDQATFAEASGFGFRAVPFDLLEPEWPLPDDYDLVLSCEVIEHLPADPIRHFDQVKRCMKVGAKLVLTTVNFGNLRNIVLLAFGYPILPPAEQLFAPVGSEYQHIHRREYCPRELVQALKTAGLKIETLHYIQPHRWTKATTPLRLMRLLVEAIVPHWRPHFLVVATKPEL